MEKFKGFIPALKKSSWQNKLPAVFGTSLHCCWLDKLLNLHYYTQLYVCVYLCLCVCWLALSGLPQSKVASYPTNAQLNAAALWELPMKLLFRLNYGSCFSAFARLAALAALACCQSYLCSGHICVNVLGASVCVCVWVYSFAILYTLLPQGNNSFCCHRCWMPLSRQLNAVVSNRLRSSSSSYSLDSNILGSILSSILNSFVS